MAKLGLRSIFMLMAIILLAVGLYQRLWVVQMDLNHERHNRQIYQKLYNEALDEVAEWRKKLDVELESSEKHQQRLQQMTDLMRERERTIQLLLQEKLKLDQEIKRLNKSQELPVKQSQM